LTIYINIIQHFFHRLLTFLVSICKILIDTNQVEKKIHNRTRSVLYAAGFFFQLCRFFIILFFITGILVSCENDPQAIKELTEKKVLVEEGKNIESFLSQGGVMRAKLTSPLMYRFQSDTIYTEFPKTLHVDFFDDSINIESRLDAMYGKYFENLNKVYLRDSVIVINIDGDTLRCPELWWDQNLQKFYTDKPARLDGKDKHIIGNEGLEATQDLKVIQFKYPTGPFQVKDGTLPQ